MSASGGRSTGRVALAAILAIIAILFIIVGVIYLTTKAGSLPSFIPGHLAGSKGHHPLRATGTLVLGVIFLVAAWFAYRWRSKATVD